ncbi:MAG: hypothetical protein M1839_003274 [Geoglossum umbratile]|nr:MAG: hypothetical protein M1839_003274 [Geoglossum umbratile]
MQLLSSLSDTTITITNGKHRKVSQKMGLEGADQVMTMASDIGSPKAFIELHEYLTHHMGVAKQDIVDPTVDPKLDLMVDHPIIRDVYDTTEKQAALREMVLLARSINKDESTQRPSRVRIRSNIIDLYHFYIKHQELFNAQPLSSRPSTLRGRGRVTSSARFVLLRLVRPGEPEASIMPWFNNIVKVGKRFSPLVKAFGKGVLCLIPKGLSDKRIKAMSHPKLDILPTVLDVFHPELREWSALVEHHIMSDMIAGLPPKKGIRLLEMSQPQLSDTLRWSRKSISGLLSPSAPRIQTADPSTPTPAPESYEIQDYPHGEDQFKPTPSTPTLDRCGLQDHPPGSSSQTHISPTSTGQPQDPGSPPWDDQTKLASPIQLGDFSLDMDLELPSEKEWEDFMTYWGYSTVLDTDLLNGNGISSQ